MQIVYYYLKTARDGLRQHSVWTILLGMGETAKCVDIFTKDGWNCTRCGHIARDVNSLIVF